MPPKFSLQSVLEFRHKRVEALEIELGQIMAAYHEAQAFLAKLHEYRQHLFGELGQRQEGEINLMALQQVRTNVKLVEQRLLQQMEEIAKLERQVQAKREDVVLARQGEETLVTLKNKETERFKAEEVQREGRLQDDIYIAQAFRRAANGAASSGSAARSL
jgi:flagellar export protein FliJ